MLPMVSMIHLTGYVYCKAKIQVFFELLCNVISHSFITEVVYLITNA